MLLKLCELLKTKLKQLRNTSSKTFHSQLFFQLKYITFHGRFLKITQLIASGKTELINAYHDLYTLLTIYYYWLLLSIDYILLFFIIYYIYTIFQEIITLNTQKHLKD